MNSIRTANAIRKLLEKSGFAHLVSQNSNKLLLTWDDGDSLDIIVSERYANVKETHELYLKLAKEREAGS